MAGDADVSVNDNTHRDSVSLNVISRASLLAAIAQRDLVKAQSICSSLLEQDENDRALLEFRDSLNVLLDKAEGGSSEQSDSDAQSDSESNSSCSSPATD